MIVVFLGPPGAGKGTQCKLVCDKYNLSHLSSGDILRRERSENTDLGKEAQGYMDSGKLVPDDLIVAMMMKEIQTAGEGKDGFILDGFPRTIGQAKELDASLEKAGNKIDIVLNLQVDDGKLEERVTGRRSCAKCGGAYHTVFSPPKQDNQCDAGCGELTQRADDNAETVRSRIENYHAQTAPLVDYYTDKGNICNVDGNVTIDEVKVSVIAGVDKVQG